MLSHITKKGRYTSYAQLCVDLTKPLSKRILLRCEDIIWEKTIDYEHIPFQCKHCHAYGHLFKDYPSKPPQQHEFENANGNLAPPKNEFVTILGKK